MAIKLLAFLVASMALFEMIEGNPELIMKTISACKDKVKPTEEDMIKMMKHGPLDTMGHKCMMNCIFEGMGLVSGGKINEDGVMAAAKDIFKGDAVKIGGVADIYKVCHTITDADPCEASAKILVCMVTEGSKKSIELPFNF